MRRGEKKWGEMSHPENPAGGVSCPQLSGVHRAEQTPSGLLECNRAGGWMEELRGLLSLQGGRVLAGDSINSSGVNHLIPQNLNSLNEINQHKIVLPSFKRFKY